MFFFARQGERDRQPSKHRQNDFPSAGSLPECLPQPEHLAKPKLQMGLPSQDPPT